MYFHIFCVLFIYFKVVFSFSCEKNALPDNIEITNNNDLILKCSKPKFSIIQKNRYNFFNNNETWHFYALNFKLCASSFTSNKCNGNNGEWISGINSIEVETLNVTCCYNENLKSAKFLKSFYIEKGQKFKAGEITTRNGTIIGFVYISNILKIVNYDKSISYKISVNKILYQKPKLPIYGITTTNIKLDDSKNVSDLAPINKNIKEENLNSIEFGVCHDNNNGNKNKTEKPCSILLTSEFSIKQLKSNSGHWSTVLSKSQQPLSKKFYQALLSPRSDNRIIPSEGNESTKENPSSNEDSEKNEDFSIEFGGGNECPSDDGTADEGGDGISELSGDSTNANSNSNADSNSNGNGNSNSQSNSNQNSQNANNPNPQNANNPNSQNANNPNSQNANNPNSQNANNPNSQNANNPNSQNANQNSQSFNNQNFQNGINQNSQTNINQNTLLQQQNINPQIVQSQNPINPFFMPMPNVPFVQNPVNPPAVAADFGNTGYYPVTGSNMACFTGDTEVQTLNGKIKRLDELDVDDWIYSAGDRKFGFTRIISWLHRMPKLKFEFIKITLANGKNLKITKNHYIYKSDCSVNDEIFQNIPKDYIEAGNLQISDCLLHLNAKNQLLPIQIIKIENIFDEGIYAPLTESGKIFVNGILASCYSEIDSHLLLSILSKLNKYFKIPYDFFKIIFFESDFKNRYQSEIDLIPGIDMLIKTLKSNLYPNYQKY